MQSIKNTSVAIMLLFLSYGVYQIIMKPMPQGEIAIQSEELKILDPDGQEPAGLNAMREDFYPDFSADDEQANSIPDELLRPSPTLPRPSTPPTSSSYPLSANDRDDLPAGGHPGTALGHPPGPLDPPDSFGGGDLNNFDQAQGNTTINPNSYLDSDLQVKPAGTDPQSFDVARETVTPENTAANASGFSPSGPAALTLEMAWPQIKASVEKGEYQQALRMLTGFYRSGAISAPERQQVLDWLDALAAKVIYSSEHHLRSIPYIIQPGDTIASLARQWKIPAQLIYNVNTAKIPDPNELTPGVELKLIEGPFDAELDPQGETMTLFLADMYAGRFNIQSSPGILPGEYVIVDKSAQDHIDRPFCIKLNNGVCIYANPASPATNDEVVLQPVEAEEIFSILSAASKIRILR